MKTYPLDVADIYTGILPACSPKRFRSPPHARHAIWAPRFSASGSCEGSECLWLSLTGKSYMGPRYVISYGFRRLHLRDSAEDEEECERVGL
eukprot:477917-Amorphochlora_amoeboformis.AAC.1